MSERKNKENNYFSDPQEDEIYKKILHYKFIYKLTVWIVNTGPQGMVGPIEKQPNSKAYLIPGIAEPKSISSPYFKIFYGKMSA